MPDKRDRDEEFEEDVEEEESAERDDADDLEEPLDDEEDIEDEDEDDGEDEEDIEDEDEDEDEPKPRQKSKSSSRRSSADKKRAERQKVSDGSDEDEPPRRSRRRSERRRSDKRRSAEKRSRRRERSGDEEPRRTSRRRAGGGPSAPRKRRKDRRDLDAALEIVEPEQPPEADIDFYADLEPNWEPGVIIGGGLGLVGVAFAVIALLTSSGQVSTISVVGLVILLIAIVLGCVGVLSRKSWGYILGIGATGLGIITGLLWSLYSVVATDLSPIWPLFFFLCNLGSAIFLFQMRWGPGPLADERARLRSLKIRTTNYTTVSGELAMSGSIAAVLASVLCGLMLMGAATGSHRPSSAAARFVDGMELEAITEAPETGSLVLARWGNEDYFFLGRVEQSRNGEEFHIVYLDGDRAWVRMQDLRSDTVRSGASVHIHVQGHEGWLPAVITQRSGNRVEADVGSQRVWVPLGMVRVREAP